MKTINSLHSKLLALTLALMASVSIQAHDFSVDGIYYNILDGNNVEVTFKGSHVNQYVNEYINSINIPNEVTINNTTYTVTRVGDGAFYACRTLNSVTIPNSVTYIGDTAFYSCDDLTTVDIGNAVTRIGDGAFFRCSFLSSITIPNSVTRIGNRAFKYCYSMTSVNIGSSVTEIGEEAFDGCTILNSVTIPNSVINIGAMAFQGCTYMTSVVIGNNVVNIGNEAFRWCYSLTSVKCHNTTPPILGENIFEWGSLEMGPYQLDTLYVPAESLNLYKEAEQWNLFNSILPIKETSYKSQWCDTWNVMMMNSCLGPDEQKTTYRYQLAQDTVVDGKTYTILNCSATAEPNTLNLDLGMVRFAEDKKVYANYGGTEYLVYDFSVQVGDILIVLTNALGDDTQKCLVHDVSIDETSNRTVITLFVYDEYRGEFIKDDYSTIKWIEGIGSENGFFEGVEKFVDGGGAKHLLCAYQGDELKYTGPLYEEYGCEYNAGQNPEDLFPTLWGLQRTSCTKTIGENENGTVWGSRSYLMQEIETATIDGKQYLLFGINDIYSYDEYCSLWLREENNKILVYSTAQKKDLVLYDFTLNVGDSLSRLYVDYDLSSVVDYDNDEWGLASLVVTEVSTITLLDGKEYKKWTFDNGIEYVEGIGSFGTSYAWNDFYQLIANGPLYSDVHSQHLVCASKNGQLLYKMDDAEMERLGAECLCEVETSYKSQWCNTWNVFTHSGGARLDSEETWQYKLDRDTIINGKLYSTVIYYLTSDPSREYYMGAVRFGDDRKVYRAIGNSESVVYDFTAQVGDTLGPGVVYDVEVDSLTNLKTIYFHPYDRYEDKYIEYATVEWIEGVGSIDGFLLAKDYGTVGGASFYLLCAYRDDELKYAANKDLGCRYNAGEVTHDHFPTLAGLSRTIYEERNTNDTTRRDDFTKVVLDLSFPTLYHSQMYLRERDNKIFVISRTYKNLDDLYEYVLYDFTLEVGDSLPMLYIDYSSRGNWGPIYPLSILNVVNYRKEADGTIYPGDTLVVTEVSTITLLDGKEYKKWTFNNGMEYAEGIGSLSGDFYELIANKRTTEDLTASQLVCASQNGQLLYKMDDAEMERLGAECLCEYNDGPKKDNAKNGKIGGRPTPTQWNMLEVETKEMDGTPTILRAETFSYTLENDSIVTKGKTFYQLARQSTKDTAITKSFVGALHFGEDEDNRVYFLRDGVEYVLYDFTAEPGDTIEIFAGINNYPLDTTYTHVVVDKDTTEDGACRMILEVVFPNQTGGTNLQKVWLAGLGSVDGIVHNAAKRTSDVHAAPAKSASSETQTSVMLCAWREDSCLYTTNHPEYDTFGCVYNQDPTALERPISPSSYQKFLREGQLLIMHDGKIYTIMGIEIK